MLRAQREGGRFEFGETVTGVRFVIHGTRSSAIQYASASPELGRFVRTLTEHPVTEVRQDILDSVGQHSESSGDPMPASVRSRFRPVFAAVYRYSGLDVEPAIRRLRGKPDKWLRSKLKVRTGEPPPRVQSLAAFLADPERIRVV